VGKWYFAFVPRFELVMHIVWNAFPLFYRRWPMDIPEDCANLAPGIKSQA